MNNNSPVSAGEFSDRMARCGVLPPHIPSIIAVAVSGGADSMCLLLLASNWAKENGAKIVALTINHNLRVEAQEEAEQVKKWCAKWDIEHHTLNWFPPSTLTAIQETARKVRYQLLFNYCKSREIKQLLLAHHNDDQIETFFFRLSRGSGLRGLAAMPERSKVSGIFLLRPLLDFQKICLIATLKHENQDWIEDPSNKNENYTRVRIRAKLKDFLADNENRNLVTELIKRFRKIRAEIEKYISFEIANAAKIFPEGYALLSLKEKISETALGNMVEILSGNEYPPRSKKLNDFYRKLYSLELTRITFSGLIFEKTNNSKILIYREAKALPPATPLPENEEIIWDKRFIASANVKLTIRQLGSDGLKSARKNTQQISRNLPPDRVLRTFPSFWHLEELVSCPHIAYMNQKPEFSSIKTNIKFSPAKSLAGDCFWSMND